SMCNYIGNRLCCDAADQAMQTHGGMGYSRHKAFEHIYRHHRRYRITEGSEEIQMRKVGAYLFGYAGPRKNEFTQLYGPAKLSGAARSRGRQIGRAARAHDKRIPTALLSVTTDGFRFAELGRHTELPSARRRPIARLIDSRAVRVSTDHCAT